jgi:hypothetical protein
MGKSEAAQMFFYCIPSKSQDLENFTKMTTILRTFADVEEIMKQ